MSLAATMIALFLEIITCILFTTIASASSPHGFTIGLIQRLSNASSSRVVSSDTELGSPYANTVFDNTEYLMKLQIGTPPFEIEAILDTGSPLVWTQCLPCSNCYHQDAPIFDPSKSSTFKEKRCDGHACPYEIVYNDESYTTGTFATETVTIHSTSGEPFVMPETVIGCSRNSSRFSPSNSGIVGLSWAPLSLVSQMGGEYPGFISYCFSGKGTSKINFGGNANIAGDGVVSTTIFMTTASEGLYYLNLEAVSVGDNRIETLGAPFHALEGNIVIDSGTTYTYFPESYCNLVKEAVQKVVTADRVVYTNDHKNWLCYISATIEIFPVITMHFSDGADLVLDKYNMYLESEVGVFCLATICSKPTQEPAIFGNRAQNNFLVSYDSSSLLVSFKPTDCSALWS